MTDKKWNSKDYELSFPDVPAYEGPATNAPILHNIGKVHIYVLNTIISEIARSIRADSELAGLVLSLALIDYITGYYIGRQAKGIDYINFMNIYFPEPYKPFNYSIYHDLRNGLLHNLSAVNPWQRNPISYFIHSNLPFHLQEMKPNKYYFSVPIFVEDIRRAWIMYSNDLIMKESEKPELRTNFEKRFNRLEGMGAYMERIP